MMPIISSTPHYRGHILFAENDTHYTASATALLELEGYKVQHIHTPQELDVVENLNIFDLAIIDIRLLDNHDEFDESGIDVAHRLPAETPKLLISLYTSSIHSAMQKEWFEEKRLPANTDWFHKEQGAERMLKKVDELFDQHYPDNPELSIATERPLVDYVRHIPRAGQRPESYFDAWSQELDLLLRRLFIRETSLELLRMGRGYGGAGLARVTPIYEFHGAEQTHTRGAAVILKFGKLDSIQVEYDNYREFVEPFLTQRATNVVGVKGRAGRLAGIRFRFIGAQNPLSSVQIQDLKTGYETLTAIDLSQIFADLFQTACGLWYSGKAESAAPIPLVSTYKGYFKFYDPVQWQEVYDTIDTVVESSPYFTCDGDELLMPRERGRAERLPHPARFADKHPEAFPAIKYQCITHGDFNSRNIFVEKNRQMYSTWLIDFFRTGNSAALRDAIQLETVIKFSLLPVTDLAQRLAFERDLLSPHSFADPLAVRKWRDVSKPFAKAIYAIMSIREMARWIHGEDDMKEYYGGLLINTLKVLTLKARPDSQQESLETRRQHTLYSAALLAKKLKNWPA